MVEFQVNALIDEMERVKEKQGEQKMFRNKILYPIRLRSNQMHLNLRKSRIFTTDFWFCAAFSRLAPACPSDSVSQAFSIFMKGVKKYEFEIYLPKLRHSLGL